MRPIPETAHRRSPGSASLLVSAVLLLIGLPRAVEAVDDGAWQELSPPARLEHTAILDPLRHRMVVYGGASYVTRGDVWAMSLDAPHGWTLLVPGGTGPIARREHSAIYDPVGDRMIVFGGRKTPQGGDELGDLWTLALAGTPAWAPLTATGTPPTARFGHTAIYDATGQRMIVFGGVEGATGDLLSEVWELSLSGTPHWALLSPAPGPVGRWYHAAIYDPIRQRMIVYGGNPGSQPYLDDVWALSLSGSPSWTQVVTSGTSPGGAADPDAIYDPVNDRMIVVLGQQVWELPLAPVTPVWTSLSIPPYPRGLTTLIYDPSETRAVLYGGWGHGLYADATALNLAGPPSWVRLAPLEDLPLPRIRHAAVLDPTRDRVVVVGASGIFEPPELWTLSLTSPETWSLLPVGGGPGSLLGVSAVYDPARDRILVFGGGFSTSKTNETWELSLPSLTWTLLTPDGTRPAARALHSAVLDPVGDRMIVFGGEDDVTQNLGDTWQLSLSGVPTWSPLGTSGTPPAARRSHDAFYDASRGHMVISGGIGGGGANLSDTWSLSLGGSPTWSPLAASGQAPARAGQPGVHDRARDRFLEIGNTGAGLQDDVRALSLGGSPAWSALAPSGVASDIRDGAAAVFDLLRDRVVLVGGGATVGTWVLNFDEAPAQAPSVTCIGDVVGTPGDDASVSFPLANPFAFGDTFDYVLTSTRSWPGLPIAGQLAIAAQGAGSIDLQIPVPDTAAAGLNLMTLSVRMHAAAWPFTCTFNLHDASTPALISVVSITAQPGSVGLRWFGAGVNGDGLVERREAEDPWRTLGLARREGDDMFAYDDHEVESGREYGYRLVVGEGAEAITTAESRVAVPTAAGLALSVATPLVTNHVAVTFTLPVPGAATLELLDLAGRRLDARRLEGLGAGTHHAKLAEHRALAAGVYLVRLTQAGRSRVVRAIVLR